MVLERLSNKQIESYRDSTARINIFQGPVRAGKSFIALLRWLDFCKSGPPGPLILCGRTDKTIKRNIITPLQDLVGNAVQYFIGKGEVTLYNRTMYVVGANDDRAEAKIRGSEFAGALLDEVSLLPENFFKMLLSRLSIPKAQLFCSTNPDSPYHWLKTDFIDREKELDLKVFSYNIHDNPTLSEKYIKDLSAEYQGLWYKRFILGDWVLADGAVYDFFDEDIHVIPMPPSEALYYILGVDYGTTNPCAFVLIGYNPNSYPNMWQEKEYYFDSKKEMRQKSDYDYALDLIDFISGYNVKKIYIDPSAASFKQELRRNGIHNVVDAVNDVVPGIRFQSQLLTNGTFKICSNCVESIKEYSNYMWDSKASEKGYDRPIKKFDHCFDGDTLVTTLTGQLPIKQIKEDDKVLTPIGYKKVLKTFIHEDEVYEFDILGKKIKCTKNHKFYTANRGWIKAKDMLLSDIILIHTDNEKWRKKPSFLMESNIQGTYAPKMTILENIIEHLSQANLRDMTLCTEPCGDSIMETFQKECIYITSTVTPLTMKLATLSSSLPANTQENISQCLLRNKERLIETTVPGYAPSQKNGIEVRRAANGTQNTLKLVSEKRLNGCSHVTNAIQNTYYTTSPHQSSVRINVKVSGEEIITLMMSKEYAKNVVQSLQLINTQKQPAALSLVEESYIGKKTPSHQNIQYSSVNTAEKSLKNITQQKENSALHRVLLNSGKKQKVYNLHVEDFHGYYANNLLVLNCSDGTRYALASHFYTKNLRPEFTESDAEELEIMYGRR